MSTETELKFRIPPARLAALRRAVATDGAQVLPLAAVYVDTPGEHLARARCALRLRREGDAWVQTLKAEGASALHRLEHNVTLAATDAATDAPVLDPGRHDGTPAGDRLRALLAAAGPGQPLVERYATRVQRTHRLLRSGGAVIELALDEGELRAGARRLVLSEIEFELLSGPPRALLALAGRWAARHGLVLDVRSKSELGHTLAAGLPGSPPAPAQRLRPAPDAAALLAQALRPVLANASQIAAGPSTGAHLGQLLASLRRLRRLLARGCFGAAGQALAPAVAALQAALGAGDAAVPLAGLATQRLWLDLLALGLPPD